ncbi:iron complex outermembrane receptor protein [Altererythrobacter atlanticus]|uniref:Vitamin B12 transporter BtuB n=1 Tax=Croceibacterium atlanticum TaxID=1267766 RepID=A0A0F7KR11_9SPHN|nr:TonB-dependent receptor [Croceibacterium atlanticum]AKH41260.1 Vitamin B12 transporter BtuB precursor [Croceibacterium atlanticum]MBB5732778.1 iron complex outermembrane receptor protein [Croceibacterium atlanticum]
MTRRHISLRAALVATCCSAPLAVAAQETPESSTEDGTLSIGSDAIINAPIVGTRIDRITLSEKQAGTSDTASIVADLPGVSAATGGGFSSMPAIRGLSEQRVNIMVDGVTIDIACPNDMNSPLSYTDPQSIGSISVLTGVAPVSHGGDNIGGVISVESAPPLFGSSDSLLVTGEVSSFYRSNGDGFGGALKLTVAGKKLSATYTGSYTQSDQYDGGGSKGLVRSTEYAKTDHALALAYQTGAGLLKLKGGYHFAPYEGFPNQYMDMVSNKSWYINGAYEGRYDWGEIDLTASYRDTDHVMNFLEDKLPGSMPMNSEVHSFDSAAKLSLPLSSRDTLKLGAEYHHQWLDDYWPPVPGNMMMGPDTFVNINEGTRDRIGAYVEWEAQWSGRLSSVAGIRIDRVEMDTGDVQPYGTGMMQMADVMAANAFNAADRERTDNNWSGSILLNYVLSDLASIELGYAHKARSPNLYERYSWGRGSMASRMIGWYGDGNGYVGNPDLDPERADTISAALSLGGSAQGWQLRIAPYYTHVDDYIDAAFLQDLTDMMGMPTGFVQLQFANQKAEFYGVDVSGAAELWRDSDGNATSLSATLAWLEGNNLTDGGPVYRQMPFNATIALAHRQGDLELGAEFEWVDEKTRVDTTRNEPATDSYALFNLSAAYTLSGVRFSIEAENLFDKGYDLPLGGVSLGDFKATGALRPVPGRGRSINIGLSTSF